MIYRTFATVLRCEERRRLVSSQKDETGTPIDTYESTGWWLVTDLGISLNLGPDKPPFVSGQKLRLTIEKEP